MMTEKFSLACDRLVSHRQLACCHSYCVVPLDGNNLLIYSNLHIDLNICPQPLLLTGHHGEISAMTFGQRSNPVLLCSASADYIIVWDIELCQKRVREGKVAAGTVIGTVLGEVVHLSFCVSDERVAACSGRKEVISSLTGHLGHLTSAEFCPWNEDILITTSEDRTFKVLAKDSQIMVKKDHTFDLVTMKCLRTKQIPTNQHKLISTLPLFSGVGFKNWRCLLPVFCPLHSACSTEQHHKSKCYSLTPYRQVNFKSPHAGHDKAVCSLSWSLSRQWWLSASEDQSVRVWGHGCTEPAIIMGNSLFSKPIRGAQFYYLDKFLLFASGSFLHLYLYNVDMTHDDIKRYEQRSVVKLAKCLTTTTATDINALSAVNDFFSCILFPCRPYRSIQVFDMNKCTVASQVPNAHSRAIHCITQNKGSIFSTQAPESYNLFLTSAVTDGVKMWDLRTLRCVRRYENHLNRCHPCSSAISPCGRFIASGSEDNCAYVYDIRNSSYLHKLQKQSDTVISVAFNPAIPEVRTFFFFFFYLLSSLFFSKSPCF
uniref:WD repeat domain 27 n=1 Tax=Echeneis naucrates TaxID=173247 RepID=A0A665WYR8_ECHNA